MRQRQWDAADGAIALQANRFDSCHLSFVLQTPGQTRRCPPQGEGEGGVRRRQWQHSASADLCVVVFTCWHFWHCCLRLRHEPNDSTPNMNKNMSKRVNDRPPLPMSSAGPSRTHLASVNCDFDAQSSRVWESTNRIHRPNRRVITLTCKSLLVGPAKRCPPPIPPRFGCSRG